MFTFSKKAITLCLCGAMAINLQAFDIGKAVSGAVSGNYGKSINFNQIASDAGLDLSKMGLDNLNLGDVINLDLGSLSAMLSVQCDYSPNIPEAPVDFCDFTNGSINTGAFNFSRTLNLGKCKVNAGAQSSGIGAGFGDMVKNYCQKVRDTTRSWMPIENATVYLTEQTPFDINSKTTDISVNSKYLKPEKLKGTDEKYRYLKGSQVYTPDGVLGFDRFYNNDKDMPKPLVTAFNTDNYKLYRAYERFAKTFKPSKRNGWSPNDSVYIDFTKFKVKPSSYMQWKNDLELNVKKIIGSYATPYVTENKIKEELDRIKKKIGKPTGSSSASLKADYLSKKTKMLKELFTLKINKKDGYTELAKAMRDLKNYERLKFAEKEEEYRRTHNYIVNPSGLKVLTKRKEEQISYMDKIMWQQTQEARRKAENERMIKMKQETLKLLTQKVFVSNLEYEPSIAQKEIDEILGQ